MQTSIFLARLLGPIFVAIAIAMASQPDSFRSILEEFIANRALAWFAGLVALLAGLALVLAHNVWSADWRILITLVGWTILAKAVAIIFLPQPIAILGSWCLEHPAILRGSAVLMIFIGAALSYFGYFA